MTEDKQTIVESETKEKKNSKILWILIPIFGCAFMGIIALILLLVAFVATSRNFAEIFTKNVIEKVGDEIEETIDNNLNNEDELETSEQVSIEDVETAIDGLDESLGELDEILDDIDEMLQEDDTAPEF